MNDVWEEIEGVEWNNEEVLEGVVVRDGVDGVKDENEMEGEKVSLMNAVCEDPEGVQVWLPDSHGLVWKAENGGGVDWETIDDQRAEPDSVCDPEGMQPYISMQVWERINDGGGSRDASDSGGEESILPVPVGKVESVIEILLESDSERASAFPDPTTLNCCDWARIPSFWGILETKFTWYPFLLTLG